MSFNLKKMNTVSRPKPPRIGDGTYSARLVQIIGLGVQETDWQGVTKHQDRVSLTFELPTETVEVNGEEQPRWLSKKFTLSLHEKGSLIQVVKALDPKGECSDLTEMLGRPCMVAVGSTETGNDKITGVMPPMKGMPVPEVYNKDKMNVFDFDNPDLEVFATLPQFMQDQIKEAINYDGFADNVKAPVKQQAKVSAKPTAKKQNQLTEWDDEDVPF